MTHQILRLGKCWKLFRATLKEGSHGILNYFEHENIASKLNET